MARGVRLVLAITMVVMTLGVALTGAWYIDRSNERFDRQSRTQAADRIASNVRHHSAVAVDVLMGVRGLFNASEHVSDVEFTRYGAWALRHPGVQAVTFSSPVTEADLAGWERATGLRVRGVGGLPVGPSPLGMHFPYRYAVGTSGVSNLLGVDPASDPVRAQTLADALQTAHPAMSPPVVLASTRRTGLFLTTPLTTTGTATTEGVVSVLVDTGDLMRQVADDLPPGSAMRVRDGALSVAGTAGAGSPTAVRSVTVADRTWTVEMWLPAAGGHQRAAVLIALLGGGAALLAGLMLRATVRRQRRTERLLAVQTEARSMAELQHQVSEQRFQTLVAEVPTGIFQMDAEGEMQYVNGTWSRLTGLTLEQARAGGWADSIHPEDRHLLRTWAEDAAAGRPMYSSFRFVLPDGEVRWVSSRVAPIREPGSDEVRGWIGSVNDITERRLAERRLAASEEQMRGVVQSIGDAIIVTDVHGNILSANPAMEQVFGYPAEELHGQNVSMLIADEHHRDAHDGYLEAYHQTGESQAVGAGRSVFGLRADGAPVPLFITISMSGSGTDARFTAVIRDLTAEMEAEEHMRRHAMQQDALREVAEIVASSGTPEEAAACAAHQAAWMLDVPTAMVVRWEDDEHVQLVTHFSPLFDAPVDDGATLPVAEGSLLAAVAADRGAHLSDRGHGLWDDDSGFAAGALAVPIVADDVLWGAMVVASHDVGAFREVQVAVEQFASMISTAVSAHAVRERLAAAAATDFLTNLPNRRAFHERMAGELERANRYGRPMSLVLFDIDHFKRVNDTYGHEVGDAVLVEVAQRMAAMVRTGEMVARTGGEEFAWILPETDVAGARIAAERARRAVADAPFDTVGVVTVSLGVCDLRDAPDGDELYRRADAALYKAKGDGRNQVAAFGETLSGPLVDGASTA